METLTKDELLLLNKLIYNKNLSMKQKEIDDLKYNNLILQLSNKYNLSEEDSINIETGIINRKETPEVIEPEIISE